MDLERMTQLLTVEEKLRGHPKLKALHLEVMKELDELAAPPPVAVDDPEPTVTEETEDE